MLETVDARLTTLILGCKPPESDPAALRRCLMELRHDLGRWRNAAIAKRLRLHLWPLKLNSRSPGEKWLPRLQEAHEALQAYKSRNMQIAFQAVDAVFSDASKSRLSVLNDLKSLADEIDLLIHVVRCEICEMSYD